MKALLLVFLALAATPAPSSAPVAYPKPPADATVETYYGTQVRDPYRPLESIDAPSTRVWVEAEAALTRRYLDAIPQREAIREHLQATANYERYSTPYHIGNRYFYYYNPGLQPQPVLYTMVGLHGTPHVLIDPNTLSADQSITIGGDQPSWNAHLLAYATQTSGSDWQTWHVRNIVTGKDLPDELQWSKFSSAQWLRDDTGFFYERYPQPASGQMYKAALKAHAVYLHVLGSPQSADRRVVYDPQHANWIYGTSTTEDGRYAIVDVQSTTSINNRIGVIDLRDPNRALHRLLWKEDARWDFVGNDGSALYFTTTLDAPNKRIVAVDATTGALEPLVGESASAMQSASYIAHRFVVSYLTDAHSVVKVYARTGVFVRDVPLPGIGTAGGFAVGLSSDRTTFYTYSGYTTPPIVYAYDAVSGANAVFRTTHVPFDPAQFVSTEIFYRSKDGTRVPMTISYRKGTPMDGTAPAMLYAYGGFDIAVTPAFSAFISSWMQMGGIYAVPNIRGGSEYGEAWHHGGMLKNKQKVFDDFIAAAEYLIDKKFTSTPKLAIRGASNGGLLIGAVETQRPDLFGAAIPMVGVLDMLRFDKFTIGSAWIPEYGCSTCGADQFAWLRAYSPLANVKLGTVYPPTLIMTSDHDDRVFPAHSFKFAAAMQAAQAGSAPILLRLQVKAGHGGSTNLNETIESYADTYAFLVKNLGMTLPAGF